MLVSILRSSRLMASVLGLSSFRLEVLSFLFQFRLVSILLVNTLLLSMLSASLLRWSMLHLTLEPCGDSILGLVVLMKLRDALLFACYRLNTLLSFLPLIQPSSLLVVLVSLVSALLLLLSSSVSIHSCDGLLALTYLDTRGFSIRVGCSTKRTQYLFCDHFFRVAPNTATRCTSVATTPIDLDTAIAFVSMLLLTRPCCCLLSCRLVY